MDHKLTYVPVQNEIHAEYSSLFSDAYYVDILSCMRLRPLWRYVTYILLIHVKIQDIYFIRDEFALKFYK